MPRYVDVERFKIWLSEKVKEGLVSFSSAETVASLLRYAPTANVAPVIHAHWIKKMHEWDLGDPPQDYTDFTCSNCKIRVQDKTPFCPFCGSEMSEEDNQCQ